MAEEVDVGVRADRTEPHQDSREHRVLHRTTEELAVGADTAVDVREDVVVDVATHPQVRQIRVAGMIACGSPTGHLWLRPSGKNGGPTHLILTS